MRRNYRFGSMVSATLIAATFAFGVSAQEQVRPVTKAEEPSGSIVTQAQQPSIPPVGETVSAEQRRSPQSVNAVAPNRPFTLASSVGTIDEDSTAIAQLRNFTVTLLPGATGSVHVRYNLSALEGISGFCPATQSTVRVRFRNSDNSGVTARVVFEIHQTNITSGGNNIIYTFTSDGRSAGGSFTTVSDTPAIDFDFANSVYWIEATVLRTDPNALADLGSIQIWENAGTACP